MDLTEGISHAGLHVSLAPGDRQPARSGPGSARNVAALEHSTPLHKPAAARVPGERAPAVSDGLRLRWREPGVADGFVDGGWWPGSLDLGAELAPLLAVFRSAGHEVTRVVYHAADWAPAPRGLTGSGRVVRLDRSGSQRPGLLSLVDASGVTRTDLVIIPPCTQRRVAQRVLALARLGGDLHRLTGILTRADREQVAGPGRPCPVDSLSAAVWDTGGGRGLAA